MIKFDRLLFNCLFGLVIPILCFLIFWWGSLLFAKEEKEIMIAAFTGLGVGIMTSLFVKLKFNPDIYCLSKSILVLVYLFYNVGMFGFFMGLPFFHPGLGVIAGYYWAKRLQYQIDIIDYMPEIKRISRFTATVIGIICMLSAILALIAKSAPSEIKHMLHLPFDISPSLLIFFILTGGLFLIFAQYFLTKITMIKTLKMRNIKLS